MSLFLNLYAHTSNAECQNANTVGPGTSIPTGTPGAFTSRVRSVIPSARMSTTISGGATASTTFCFVENPATRSSLSASTRNR